MDFLKAILGDDLYSQVEAKVNAYNDDKAPVKEVIMATNPTVRERCPVLLLKQALGFRRELVLSYI